jgi:hypothetical protein
MGVALGSMRSAAQPEPVFHGFAEIIDIPRAEYRIVDLAKITDGGLLFNVRNRKAEHCYDKSER